MIRPFCQQCSIFGLVLFVQLDTAAGEKPGDQLAHEVRDASEQIDKLCAVVSDVSEKPKARQLALTKIVETHLIGGIELSKLSRILSGLKVLKDRDYEIVRAFAGAWPFDEKISRSGNTLVGFRVTWGEEKSTSTVFLLIEGRLADERLKMLFSGEWPTTSRLVLKAASIVHSRP